MHRAAMLDRQHTLKPRRGNYERLPHPAEPSHPNPSPHRESPYSPFYGGRTAIIAGRRGQRRLRVLIGGGGIFFILVVVLTLMYVNAPYDALAEERRRIATSVDSRTRHLLWVMMGPLCGKKINGGAAFEALAANATPVLHRFMQPPAVVGFEVKGGTPSASFQRFFHQRLLTLAGAHLAAALFDPRALFARAEALWSHYADHEWASRAAHRRTSALEEAIPDIVHLQDFNRSSEVLYAGKGILSVGLGRLYWDEEVAALYTHLFETTPQTPNATVPEAAAARVAQEAFARALDKVLLAYVDLLRHMVLMAQALLHRDVLSVALAMPDTCPAVFGEEAFVERGRRWRPWEHRAPTAAFIHLLARVDVTKPASEVLEDLDTQLAYLALWSVLSRPSSDWGAPRRAVTAALESLDARVEWVTASPLHWSQNRSFSSVALALPVTCTSLTRGNEDSEGARYLCNGEYLLHANKDVREWLRGTEGGLYASASNRSSRHGHTVLGVGSNHNYHWEWALARTFNGHPALQEKRGTATTASTTLPLSAPVHPHYWARGILMDCTMSNWSIPSPLWSAYAPLELGYAEVCLAGAAGNTSTLRIARVSELRRLLDGRTAYPVHHHLGRKERKNGDDGGGGNSGDASWSAAFDEVSIFKFDIETDEFGLVDDWYDAELLELARHTSHRAAAAPVSWRRTLHGTAYPSHSIVMSEIHLPLEVANVYPLSLSMYNPHVFATMQRATLHLLRMGGLGFVGTSAEMNPQSHGCAEHTHAHYRYLLKSEVWMALHHWHATAAPAAVADTAAPEKPIERFDRFFLGTLERVVGPAWARAMYDEGLVLAARSNPMSTILQQSFFDHSDQRSLEMLRQAKQLVSLALWRIQQDAELAALYTFIRVDCLRTTNATTASHEDKEHCARLWQSYTAALGNVVRSLLVVYRSAVQYAFDVIPYEDPRRKALLAAFTHYTPFEKNNGDPFVRVAESITLRPMQSIAALMAKPLAPLRDEAEAPRLLPYYLSLDGRPAVFNTVAYRLGRPLFAVLKGLHCATALHLAAGGTLCNGGYALHAPRDVRDWLSPRPPPRPSPPSVPYVVIVSDGDAASGERAAQDVQQLVDAMTGHGSRGSMPAVVRFVSERGADNGIGGKEEGDLRHFAPPRSQEAEEGPLGASTAPITVLALHFHKDGAEDAFIARAAFKQLADRSMTPAASNIALYTRIPPQTPSHFLAYPWYVMRRHLYLASMGFTAHATTPVAHQEVQLLDTVHYRYYVKSEMWAALAAARAAAPQGS